MSTKGFIMLRDVKATLIDFSRQSSSVYWIRVTPNDFEKLLIP